MSDNNNEESHTHKRTPVLTRSNNGSHCHGHTSMDTEHANGHSGHGHTLSQGSHSVDSLNEQPRSKLMGKWHRKVFSHSTR